MCPQDEGTREIAENSCSVEVWPSGGQGKLLGWKVDAAGMVGDASCMTSVVGCVCV